MHLLRGIFRGDSLLAYRSDFRGYVFEIKLESRDDTLLAKRPAVAGQHKREAQFLESFERRDPFVEVRVAHVSDAGSFLHVAGTNDALLRQVDEGVAGGVAASEK